MNEASKRGISRLMLRLPVKRAVLQRKHAASFEFSELCEAYDLACDAAVYWDKSTAANALSIASEYRALVPDIEQDIISWLLPSSDLASHQKRDALAKRPRQTD